jgi:Cu+-exporting ATPase
MAIGTGTDVAVESADVVLMRGDLNEVSSAIALSRATIRNIKQNLFWAFIYNMLGLTDCRGGALRIRRADADPIFAGAAMALSLVSVVSNAAEAEAVPRKIRRVWKIAAFGGYKYVCI